MIVNVDDHAAARFIRTRVLTDEGNCVREVGTAAEARQHGSADETELTLLDVNLPDGSGFDVCRALKRERPFSAVIMISATHRTTEARLNGLAAGADDFVMEPAPPKRLRQVVRGFLGYVPNTDGHNSGWVITDPAGMVEAASKGMAHVLNLTVRNLTHRRLTDYLADRPAASSLLV